jgi:hypothetical protein
MGLGANAQGLVGAEIEQMGSDECKIWRDGTKEEKT